MVTKPKSPQVHAGLDAAAAVRADDEAVQWPDRQRVVLVVDDDPEIRDVVRWLLEDEGWVVETASDGRDAVEQATRARPALIVLDMGLPILNGEEVAQHIRAAFRNPPPIIVVSADGRAGEKAARLGAASYLHKPFDVDELARRVRQTLAAS